MKDYNLHTILRLPTGIFYANGSRPCASLKRANQQREYGFTTTGQELSTYLWTCPMLREHLQDLWTVIVLYGMQDRKQTYSEDNPTEDGDI